MIKIIMGQKGMGKTKMIIDQVNNAINVESGNVVCISKDRRFVYDINHKARLIDTESFSVKGFDVFYGFLCGVIAQDYDVTHIFIDSVTKIVEGTLAELEAFLPELERLASKFNISFTITISGKDADAPDGVRKYFA